MLKSKSRVMAVSAAAVVALLVAAAVPAFGQDRTWGGGSNGALPSGDLTWETPGNWSGDDFPDSSAENAIIGDATADRNISTGSDGKLEFGVQSQTAFEWTQSTGGVVSTITLNRDFETNGHTVINNNAIPGDGSNMIFDLIGHTWIRNEAGINMLADRIRYVTSAPGGILRSDTMGLDTGGSIGPGVTVSVAWGGSTIRGAWDPTSLIRGTASRFDFDQIRGAGLGNLQIGDPGFGVTLSIGWSFQQIHHGDRVRNANGPALGISVEL